MYSEYRNSVPRDEERCRGMIINDVYPTKNCDDPTICPRLCSFVKKGQDTTPRHGQV